MHVEIAPILFNYHSGMEIHNHQIAERRDQFSIRGVIPVYEGRVTSENCNLCVSNQKELAGGLINAGSSDHHSVKPLTAHS